MDIKCDLYKKLDIDRSWDEDRIKERLKELQRVWIKRQSATNDKEQLLLIDEIISNIDDGFKYLIKQSKREEYDKALGEAYQSGLIVDEVEEQNKDKLQQANSYFMRQNLPFAMKFCREAIEGGINDPKAFLLLADIYSEQNNYRRALSVIDSGVELYPDNVELYWKGARLAILDGTDYLDAQKRINKLFEVAPLKSIAYAEQVKLHLTKGEEDLAFREIDAYIARYPDDRSFKQDCAYNICAHSSTYYYTDQTSGSTFIADKESYENCVKLCSKAVEIWNDEHTQNTLKWVQFFGQKQWNSWNTESVKSLTIYGALLCFVYAPIGIALLVMDAILVFFSFRPYWQINKTYVTGEMGTAEQIVSVIGDYAGRFGGVLIRFLWNATIALIKFAVALASGRFFG